MSQAELPDRMGFQLRRDEDKRLFRKARHTVAERRGVEPGDLSRRDVVAALAEHYVDTEELARLREDERARQAIEHIAEDYGMEPDEISTIAAVKAALAAYNGWETPTDWHEI